MDSKLFRLPTEPNFYKSIENASPVNTKHRQPGVFPAPDSRFPGWAGPMSDARLVTDYSTHCSRNIPVGKQYPTTLWMQRNAEGIIDYSRHQTAVMTGSILPFEKGVVPPPTSIVSCSRSGCQVTGTNMQGGIGTERHESELPELFGTYSSSYIIPPIVQKPKTDGTRNYEGGRNSLRGALTPDSYYS